MTAPRTTMFPANSALSKPDQVYTYLKKSILAGELAAGSHLTETEICQMLNTSRTPVHQAVIQLEGEHLVRLLPKKGLMILEIDPKDIINLYEVAEALESRAARLAADCHTAFLLQRMEQLSELIDADSPKTDDTHDLNYLFHMAVAEASGNELLCEMIRTTRERLSLLRFSPKLASSSRDAASEKRGKELSHTQLVSAIRRHDTDDAERIMREHIAFTKNHIVRNIAIGY